MTDVADAVVLPIRQQVDPFVGYKAVSLKLTKGGKIEVGGYVGSVTLDATAKCSAWPRPEVPHEAPDVNCKCGLYALDDAADVSYGYRDTEHLATVELFGTVIVGETGWRASRQRILDIALGTSCRACDLFGDVRRAADAVYFSVTGDMLTLCAQHGELAVNLNAAIRQSPDDLTARLGVPVSWML